MKIQEITEAIRGITEDSVKKLKVESWLSLELGRIVNRRTYWWRKAALEFSSVAGQATYDLTTGGAPIAADFLQAASPLYQFDGGATPTAQLPFVADHLGMLTMRRSTVGGTPTLWTVELGTSKTLRLAPIPNAVIPYAAVYYRGAVINWNSPNVDDVPLIPPEFHYVLYQAMERRAFFYLYGQRDPRATIAAQAEQAALADLDSYKSPSTTVAVEWRSSDEQSFVRSTR